MRLTLGETGVCDCNFDRGARQVLRTEQDFNDVMTVYMDRVASQKVVHAEIFFDPQVHTMRGVGFEVFMPGLIRGIKVICRDVMVQLMRFTGPKPQPLRHDCFLLAGWL